MSERKIKCEACNLPMGSIRDAKLRKGIVYLCSDCESKRKAVFEYMRLMGEPKNSNPLEGILDGLRRYK